MPWFEGGYEFYILYIGPVLEVIFLSIVLYWGFVAIDRISAGGKIKGMAVALAAVVIAAWGSRVLKLHAVSWLLETAITFSAVILAVVFQPEMRRLFIRMGALFSSNNYQDTGDKIDSIVDAVNLLSADRIGALIVFERGDHLDNYVASAPFDCAISVRSLQTIFWKNSPVHDGSVIIRRGRIVAAGVILPLTQNFEYRHLSGTRHRAGIGISEDTDALALLVSEETGKISIADHGKLHENLSRTELQDYLRQEFGMQATRRFTQQ